MTDHDGISGGGTGGGVLPSTQKTSTDGAWSVPATQVRVVAIAPLTAVPPDSVITLLAAGENGLGTVDVRGGMGVRVSAGPPAALPTH